MLFLGGDSAQPRHSESDIVWPTKGHFGESISVIHGSLRSRNHFTGYRVYQDLWKKAYSPWEEHLKSFTQPFKYSILFSMPGSEVSFSLRYSSTNTVTMESLSDFSRTTSGDENAFRTAVRYASAVPGLASSVGV
jgi:hypothetical protein